MRPSPTSRVASTPRTFDRQTNEWKDGEALFLRCNVWRQAAENVAESLQPRHARHRAGPAQAAVVRDAEGEKRTVIELEVDEVGPSLRYATAKVNKVARSGGGGGYGGGGGGGGGGRRLGARPAATTTRGAPRRLPAVGARGGRRAAVLSAASPSPHQNHQEHHNGQSPSFASPRRRSARSARRRPADIDYKDTALLRKFISDRGKIRARRVTGNCIQHQRDVAIAVKNAREMALLPYTSTAR